MNSLSWIIYAADVAGTLGALGGFVAFMGAGMGFVCLSYGYDQCSETGLSWGKWLLVAAAIGAVVVTFSPSKNTIYAIAASELGEEVLQSPVATKAGKALEAWLDQQIEGVTK